MRLFIITIFLCSFGLAATGQSYHYVYDPDMFALVRERPGTYAPVADTLWMMQVVKTGRADGNWLQVEGNERRPGGWVHNSRLRPMPEGAAEYLDEILEPFYRPVDLFIAGLDIPEVVLITEAYEYSLSRNEFGNMEVYMRPGEESITCHIPSREILKGWGVPDCLLRVDIKKGRLLMFDELCQVVYMRDASGKGLQAIVPLRDFPVRQYTPEEMARAAETATRAMEATAGLDGEQMWLSSLDILGVNNFDLLHTLRSMYFYGDPRGRDYMMILQMMPTDGGGGHETDTLMYEVWLYENAGVRQLD